MASAVESDSQAASQAAKETLPSELDAALARRRRALLARVQEQLAAYDASATFPRPQDRLYECRDGYEEHLLGEAAQEVRKAMAATAAPLTASSLEPSTVLLGLMAVHISTEARLQRLRHVLQSIAGQVPLPGRTVLFVAISWSAASFELESGVQTAIKKVQASVRQSDSSSQHEASGGSSRGLSRVFAIEQPGRCSQFQHLQAALSLAEQELATEAGTDSGTSAGSVWVLFGDDDDIWHSRRAAEYALAISAHSALEGVGAFATTARANCSEEAKLTDEDLPLTQAQVDDFLSSGRGVRLDEGEAGVAWRCQLRMQDTVCVPVIPTTLHLEYFDYCPRLRLVQEFFAWASQSILAHRYCDLLFAEFMRTYSRMGSELGLEVSFFHPPCWVLFYATPIPDDTDWEESVEQPKGHQASAGINVNNGHMSSKVEIEPRDTRAAKETIENFRVYDQALTLSQLSRYWAMYRSTLEIYLIPKHKTKIDQRVLEQYVFLSVNASFFGFARRLSKMCEATVEHATQMMCLAGEQVAQEVAAEFDISVLWVQPNAFLGRECSAVFSEEEVGWMQALQGHGLALREAPMRIAASRRLVTVGLRQNGLALEFAAKSLRGEPQVVLAALTQNALALAHASAELRADRDVVLFAARKCGLALEFASEALRDDLELVRAAVEVDADALGFASARLRRERELLLAAVRVSGHAIRHASEELRGDREVALAAVQQDGAVFRELPAKLRGDLEVAAAAVRRSSLNFRHVDAALRGQREIVLAAVRGNSTAMEHASPELLGDREFLLAAVMANGLALEYVPRRLRADRDFMLQVVRRNGFALKYATEPLRADREVVQAAMQQDSRALEYAASDLRAQLEAERGGWQ